MRLLKHPGTHPLAHLRLVRGCQGLFIGDSSGGKSTKAHMSGSRVMGRDQAKVVLSCLLRLFLSSSSSPQPREKCCQREADGARRCRVSQAMVSHQGVWWDPTVGFGARELYGLIHVLHPPLSVLWKQDCRGTRGSRVRFVWVLWHRWDLKWTMALAVIATRGPHDAGRHD